MRRPAELDDVEWLRRRYANGATDAEIMLELGVKRPTVRKARERHGIEGAPVGRRRGTSTVEILPSVRQRAELDQTETAVIARYRHARERKVPAHPDSIAAALRAYYGAQHAGDESATDSALLDMAAAAALIHDHRLKLRRAA